MNKKIPGIVITIILIFSLVASSFSFFIFGNPERDVISGTGTVKFIDLEGGFYGLIGDHGERYNPINLNSEYKVDGLRVRFEAKILEDTATIQMWGTPIEVIEVFILE